MKAWLAMLALAASGCAYHSPTAPTTAVEPSTAPASIRLVGSSESGSVIAMTATVLDGRLAGVPGVTVAFTSSAGSLEAASAATGPDGSARVRLTTTAMTTVTAQAGTVSATVNVLGVPPPPPPLPPSVPLPPLPPAPTPTPTPPAQPFTPSITVTCTGTASLQTRCVAASDSGTLTVDSWQWGDGETVVFGNGPIQTHAYAKAGSYVVVVSAHTRGSAIGTGSGVAEVK